MIETEDRAGKSVSESIRILKGGFERDFFCIFDTVKKQI